MKATVKQMEAERQAEDAMIQRLIDDPATEGLRNLYTMLYRSGSLENRRFLLKVAQERQL